MNDIKNRSIQYHIFALNAQKNLMNLLNTLEKQNDIEKVMIVNDELTKIVYKGENEYRMFLSAFNNSRESLEFCILFYKYSMVCIN